jgi:hypothetical protein
MSESTLQTSTVEYWVSWTISDHDADTPDTKGYKPTSEEEFHSFYNNTSRSSHAIRHSDWEKLNHVIKAKWLESGGFYTAPRRIVYTIYQDSGATGVALAAMGAGSKHEEHACYAAYKLLRDDPNIAFTFGC